MVSIIRNKLIIAFAVFAALIIGGSQLANAFSIREFLGLDKSESARETPKQPAKQPAAAKTATEAVTDKDFRLHFEEVEKIVSVINPEQRKVILADEEAFRNFINNEARNKSLLAAAHANRIDQNERNRFIAQRGAENVIREIYLNQLLASKIPADFPTEEQMRTHYENNKDNYTLAERLPVWQIFLPVEEDAGTKDIELLKKQAETIVTDINKGKLDFAEAARQYSAQQASKLRGGYLGLVRVADLKPDIQKPLLALDVDKLSSPVTTENGIHILKRGEIQAQQLIAFDAVKNQIRDTMNTQLRNQIRQAVFRQATEVYPAGITDKNVEEWRLKLRTQTGGDAAVSSQQ